MPSMVSQHLYLFFCLLMIFTSKHGPDYKTTSVAITNKIKTAYLKSIFGLVWKRCGIVVSTFAKLDVAGQNMNSNSQSTAKY